MTYANSHANGATMADWPPLTTFATGDLYEITVTGYTAHPFHVHISPYQITAMGADSYGGGYWQVGDWHDTLMISEATGTATVRILTNDFTGKMVVHCHILEHEDEGMMGFIQIGGTEGAVLSATSGCYSSAWTSTAVTSSGTTGTTATTGGDAATAAPTSALISSAMRGITSLWIPITTLVASFCGSWALH
jgi:hypothetical protein